MSRNFGIEIECTNITESRAVIVLREAGINVDHSSYHRADYSRWNVSPDASVIGGCEVISPILNGDTGLEEIKRVCKALSDAGVTVNKSCGLHVHVDASGLTGPWVRHIVKRYNKFESTIDSFMPESRRANNNSRYIASMSGALAHAENSYSSYWNSSRISDVCGAMTNRYQKLNLCSYSRTRTIEFRHHSGSVNGSKITNWVQFVLAFVEASHPDLMEVPVEPVAAPVARRRGRPSRAEQMASSGPVMASDGTPMQASEYLLSSRSARKIYNRLVLNLNTWVSVSELSQASDIGIESIAAYISTIRSQLGVDIMNDRIFGYKLTSTNVMRQPNQRPVRTAPVVAQAPATVPIANDEWTRGIPAHLVSYYTERAMELNSQSA